MKRFVNDNLWTWAGTGLALITLSGVVLNRALAIAGIAVLVQCALAIVADKDTPE